MPQSSSLHVAIVMDGNGRWATRRGLPRVAGHRAGAEAVRRTVEAAPGLGVAALTLYAFSADNWKRPAAEVAALMRLLARYLRTETPRLARNDVRLELIGRRDRLPGPLLAAIGAAEHATARNARLHLRLAVDYSSRWAIGAAALLPDVDLLIRTGGEQRLSDFLLWECAYAELYFTDTMWPDFGAAELAAAVAEFRARERRFGGLPEAAAGCAPSAAGRGSASRSLARAWRLESGATCCCAPCRGASTPSSAPQGWSRPQRGWRVATAWRSAPTPRGSRRRRSSSRRTSSPATRARSGHSTRSASPSCSRS